MLFFVNVNLRKILDRNSENLSRFHILTCFNNEQVITYVLLLDFTNHYLPEFEDKMDLVENFNCFLKLRKKIVVQSSDQGLHFVYLWHWLLQRPARPLMVF